MKQSRKEALYVQVPTPEGSVEFHDASTHIGRLMPFKNPKAICGMRVTADAVVFSYLHLTKKSAKAIAQKELLLPRGPLTRIEKKSLEKKESLQPNEVFIEGEGHEQICVVERNENGVISLEPKDNGEDVMFNLPRGALKLNVFVPVEKLGRMLAIGFIGHPGKPGSPTTLRRVGSNALYSLAYLPQFRMLTGFETVSVPSAPLGSITVVRKAEDRVQFEVPVWLYNESAEPEPVGSGSVVVEVDLDNANTSTGKLLYHMNPSDNIEEVFPQYRKVTESTLNTFINGVLGEDEVRAIMVDIVLGDIGAGSLERLRDGFAPLQAGLEMTPDKYKLREEAE